MFEPGDRVKNRFRQDNLSQYTQFGTVVRWDGLLVLIRTDNRSYEACKHDYDYCVPSDWIPVNNGDC